VVFAQAPEELKFVKCNGFAAPGEKPVANSDKNCWNPEAARPQRMERPPVNHAMPNINFNPAFPAPNMTAQPAFSQPPMPMPNMAIAPGQQSLRAIRNIRLPMAQNPKLPSSLVVSEHNPVCYTFNFSGFLYQFCFNVH
jgi:hypothetical protein